MNIMTFVPFPFLRYIHTKGVRPLPYGKGSLTDSFFLKEFRLHPFLLS